MSFLVIKGLIMSHMKKDPDANQGDIVLILTEGEQDWSP